MQGIMAPVDVAHRAIEERSQQKRGLGITKFEVGRRDNHNSHHDDDDDKKESLDQPVFPPVSITPVSTTVFVASTSTTPPSSTITSFTTPETGSATTEPSSTSFPLSSTTIFSIPTATPTTTQVPTTSSSIVTTASSSVTTASSFIATTASSSVTTTPTSTVNSDEQPRKQGDNGNHHDSNANTSVTGSLTTSATALFETSAPSASQSVLADPSFQHHDSLSPTAEHLLIVAGTLGFVIIAAFSVWCVLRIRKNGGFKSIFKRQTPETYPPPPEYYPQTQTLPAEKASPRKFSAFYIPTPAPPPTAAELSLANTQRQELVRSALLENPAPMGLSPTPPPKSHTPPTRSATEEFYGTPQVPADNYFPANMYRASELSSLSSGFGDAKIDVPESGPSTLEAARKSLAYHTSRPMFSHFSFGKETAPSHIDSGNRDTIYTQASEAPRFRSIHSWVSQQTTRVERQLSKAKNIGEKKETHLGHRRLDSEDPALRIHPGQEVELERGTRVASSILDTKVVP